MSFHYTIRNTALLQNTLLGFSLFLGSPCTSFCQDGFLYIPRAPESPSLGVYTHTLELREERTDGEEEGSPRPPTGISVRSQVTMEWSSTERRQEGTLRLPQPSSQASVCDSPVRSVLHDIRLKG